MLGQRLVKVFLNELHEGMKGSRGKLGAAVGLDTGRCRAHADEEVCLSPQQLF